MKRITWIIIICGSILLLLVVGLPYLYLMGERSYQEVTIPAEGYELNGYLDNGTDPDGAWIILVHGNRKDGQSHELYRQIRNQLSERISMLALDLRGFGGSSSEGMEHSENILNRIVDIDAAVKYLKDNYGVDDNQIILIGHSLGASHVMKAAIDQQYRTSIPIGLGDWDRVLADPDMIEAYKRKFFNNTGVRIDTEEVMSEGIEFSSEYLFSDCPETPVQLVFAGRDEGREELSTYYREAYDRCGEDIQWNVIPLSNHMYGTESTRFPKVLSDIASRIYLSMLMFRLNNIITNS